MSEADFAAGIDEASLCQGLAVHSRELHAYVHRHIPSDLMRFITADDVLQDAAISAYRSRHTFVQEDSRALLRWLTSICRNKLVDALRQTRRRITRPGFKPPQFLTKAENSSYTNLLAQFESNSRTPSSICGTAEAARIARLAMARLPDEQRDVLEQRFISQHEVEEIARRIEKSPSAVRGIIRRALESLRQCFVDSTAALKKHPDHTSDRPADSVA